MMRGEVEGIRLKHGEGLELRQYTYRTKDGDERIPLVNTAVNYRQIRVLYPIK
eukprot:XP_001705470.1 Hypothetical protein GL50803_112191 [Giardia lamblia ATCC 50803]